MPEIPDLWPNIVEIDLVTPLSILKAQAASLGKKTNNLLIGETSTETWGTGFRHVFIIYAPTLDYRLQVFQITHPLEMYPVTGRAWGGVPTEIENEKELLDWIGSVFNNERTLRTLQSLIAQVKSV